MQNKPNLKDVQMNVSIFSTTDYENIANRTLGQNKPNQTQLKPILSAVGGFRKGQNELKIFYENIWPHPMISKANFYPLQLINKGLISNEV